jgi:hypothetical protein
VVQRRAECDSATQRIADQRCLLDPRPSIREISPDTKKSSVWSLSVGFEVDP